MSKKCKNCGAELPEQASFCPHCTSVQNEKQEIKAPKLWRKKTKIALGILVGIAVLALLVLVMQRPKIYEGGAEVIYEDEDGTWHVLANFTVSPDMARTPMEEIANEWAVGEAAYPSQLCIYKEESDEMVWQDFMEKVESYSVDTIPQENGEKMEYTEAAHIDVFSFAALTSNVLYTPESGVNEVVWTLNMKNGDTIVLRHQIKITKQKAVFYYPEDTAMETSEDLQRLIDKIAEDVDFDAVVYLYLPAVKYEDAVSLSDHIYMIYGSDDGTMQTTFANTLKIQSTSTKMSEIVGVKFEGPGTLGEENAGIGLNAYSAVRMNNCTVSGWENGAVAQNGSWINVIQCTFENNNVGLKFDTVDYRSASTTYANNVFSENGVAVLIHRLGKEFVLSFKGSRFVGNDEDVRNLTEVSIDLSEAIFE